MYHLRCSTGMRYSASRAFRTSATVAYEDIRERLTAGVKTAMKNRDTVASTTLRSVLSEVYNLDKSSGSKASSSTVVGVLRKAILRRRLSVAEFTKGGRTDLVEREAREAEIISAFVPPMMPEAQIDLALKEVLAEYPEDSNSNPCKSLGVVLKTFYSKVDKSNVDADLVKRRAEALLYANSS
ncbi:Yqey-like protein-domain-containing protein [Scleroderma yunnanense]